jgi:hypothetical protein
MPRCAAGSAPAGIAAPRFVRRDGREDCQRIDQQGVDTVGLLRSDDLLNGNSLVSGGSLLSIPGRKKLQSIPHELMSGRNPFRPHVAAGERNAEHG